MELQTLKDFPQNQAQTGLHEALAGKRVKGVISEKRTLEWTANDLRNDENAGELVVITAANEVGAAIEVVRLPKPDTKGGRCSGWRNPGAVQVCATAHGGAKSARILCDRCAQIDRPMSRLLSAGRGRSDRRGGHE